jgi:hypothetical protein
MFVRIEPASRTKNRTRTEPLIGRTRTEPELFKQQDNKNQNRTEPCPYKNPNRTRTIDLRFFPISNRKVGEGKGAGTDGIAGGRM